ncbi:MAG: S9 family peptidase [Cryomorphaceae bacterium]|nr:MAG: S9 family peptidase [Cryomorphaceae bacterium]
MKNFVPYLLLLAPMAISCDSEPQAPSPAAQLQYPITEKVDQVDDYFGNQIEDPFRWLEDDNAPDTEAWVKEQNKVTESFMSQIPYRKAIRERFAELYNYPKVSSPRKVGEYYFFYKNTGLQNQSVIYYQKGLDGEPKVFIDPNELSEDGTVSIGLLGASPDHRYMAYTESAAGSDWSVIRIREIENNTDLEDELRWVKFTGAAWLADGFYYSRYPEPEKGKEYSGDNKDHSIYFHKVGTPQSEDVLFYRNEKNPNLYHWCSITEDKKYLHMYVAEGTDGYETHIKDMENDGPLTPLFRGFKNKSNIVNHIDGRLLVYTDIDAPNYRLISLDPNAPQKENWVEIIPEEEHLLDGVSTGGGKLFADYLENATTRLYQMDYSGENRKEISLPGAGSAGGLSGKKDDKILFYTYTSFNYPPTIFKYDVESGESSLFNQPELAFDPGDFESKQVWYKSKDGTPVSMFIVHKKGLELNGNNPTLLYGYGGFNISLTPSFSVSNIILLENGGVYAVANLRGGGEYGEEWHKAGMKENKQNVFDDFIAAAEYLIKERYTSNERLAIRGGSNGGLLVGAAMTQRPELFQVAIPQVGVLDMLRFHRFTVGKGWIPEYGCADSSDTEFRYLLAYSPLHNLKDGTAYPATLITTADHDDRVVPAHSFKFAARLQEAHRGKNPVLIRVEVDAGHGAGKPTSKIIEEASDIWAFMLYNMGIESLYGVGPGGGGLAAQ